MTVVLTTSPTETHVGEEVDISGTGFGEDVWISFLNPDETEYFTVKLTESGGAVSNSGVFTWQPDSAGIWTVHAKGASTGTLLATAQVEVFTD